MKTTIKTLMLVAAIVVGTTTVMGQETTVTTTTTKTTVKTTTKKYFSYTTDDYPLTKKDAQRTNYFCLTRPMGLGIGFVGTLGAPDNLNTSMGRSIEIDWHILSFGYKFDRHNTLSIGFGLLWRNFRMVNNNYFSLDENSGVLSLGQFEGKNPDFSRIHTFAITIPILYRYKWNNGMHIYAGAQLAFNTLASVKTCYSENGQEFENLNTNVHVPAVNVDIVACAAYKWLGVYLRYSPMNVLDTDFTDSTLPAFQSITAGMRFVF